MLRAMPPNPAMAMTGQVYFSTSHAFSQDMGAKAYWGDVKRFT
jgi:hypothetical protein